MTTRSRLSAGLFATLVALTALGACARESGAGADVSTAEEDAAATGEAAAPDSAAPAVAGGASSRPATGNAAGPATGSAAAAGVQQESATTAAADAPNQGERALERLTQLPAQDQLPGGKWQAGKHYTVIVPAQPTSVGPGRVEVVEMFWYGCGHCYQLDPFLESWKKNKAAYIDFVRVPVTWGQQHKWHARLYYTLAALGKLDELHAKVFDAIHRGGRPLLGNDEASTLAAQAAWAKSQGIAEDEFRKAWNSFTVASQLQRADQLMRRYRVEGVPLMVVNGKYSTDVGAAGGQSQLVALINDLAASETRR